MIAGDATERIDCPQCEQEHSQTRFDGKITCKSCGAVFKFSHRSQMLLLGVIALVVAVGVISGVTLYLFGQFAGLLVVSVGTVAVFGLLVYQGTVPQAELIAPSKSLKSGTPENGAP